MAWLRNGGWGPECLVPEVAGTWRAVCKWADDDQAPLPDHSWAPRLDWHRSIIRKLAASPVPVPAGLLRRAAGSVYVATFAVMDNGRSLR